MEIARILVYVLAFGGASIILIFRAYLNLTFKWVGAYLLFVGISQLAAYLIIPVLGSNHLLYNLAMIIHFALIYAILYNLLSTLLFKRILIVVFAFFGILFAYLLFPEINEQFASRALTVLNLTTAVGCLLFYYELLQIPESLSITRQGKFWVAAAFLIHHVSSFVIWLIYEIPPQGMKMKSLMVINFALVILLYSILILATFVQLKNQPNAKHQ